MNYCQFRNQTIKRMAVTSSAPILPPEYQQVKYLQSNGSQYFHIGKLYYYSYFDIDFEFVSFVNNAYGAQYNFNGMLGANNINESGLGQIDTKVSFYNAPGISVKVRNTPMGAVGITANAKYNLYISKDSVKLGGETISTTTAEQITGTWDCGVFACYGGGTPPAQNACAMKLYRLKSNYVDLYPCYRKSDKKPGMYDINHDVFYTNLGTGEFTVGNNV